MAVHTTPPDSGSNSKTGVDVDVKEVLRHRLHTHFKAAVQNADRLVVVKDFIDDVIDADVRNTNEEDFFRCLSDGRLLLRLISTLNGQKRDDTAPETPGTRSRSSENLARFNDGCRKLGLPESCALSSADFSLSRYTKILNCLWDLRANARRTMADNAPLVESASAMHAVGVGEPGLESSSQSSALSSFELSASARRMETARQLETLSENLKQLQSKLGLKAGQRTVEESSQENHSHSRPLLPSDHARGRPRSVTGESTSPKTCAEGPPTGQGESSLSGGTQRSPSAGAADTEIESTESSKRPKVEAKAETKAETKTLERKETPPLARKGEVERSQSTSPSVTAIDLELAKENAQLKRELKDLVALERRAAAVTAEGLRGLRSDCGALKTGLRGFLAALQVDSRVLVQSMVDKFLLESSQYGEQQARLQELLKNQARWEERYQAEKKMRRKMFHQIQELKGNVRVYCRVRPVLPKEEGLGEEGCVQCPSATEVLLDQSLMAGGPENSNNNNNNNNNSKSHTRAGSSAGSRRHAVNSKGRAAQVAPPKSFEFDGVFPPSSTQEQVFKEVSPLVVSVLDGYRACIFAYGQTGAGKTFTMEGRRGPRPSEVLEEGLQQREHESDPKRDLKREGDPKRDLERDLDPKRERERTPNREWEPAPQEGVTYRAIRKLFDACAKRAFAEEHRVSVTMVEIYNEAVKDLLSGSSGSSSSSSSSTNTAANASSSTSYSSSNASLEVRQGPMGMYLPGAVSRAATNAEQVMEAVEEGNRNRTVHATNANEHSSRSHSVILINVEVTEKSTSRRSYGKLALVDLAGSERLSKTAAEGDRLKEAQHINRSLSALGDVVASLLSKSKHIPFRNSKLTHLLQDCLGKEGKALMLVHVSPLRSCLPETLCSLTFAQRVQMVELGAAKKKKDNGELLRLRDQCQKSKEEAKENEDTLNSVRKKANEAEKVAEEKDEELKSALRKLKVQEKQLKEHDLQLADRAKKLAEAERRVQAAEAKAQEAERRREKLLRQLEAAQTTSAESQAPPSTRRSTRKRKSSTGATPSHAQPQSESLSQSVSESPEQKRRAKDYKSDHRGTQKDRDTSSSSSFSSSENVNTLNLLPPRHSTSRGGNTASSSASFSTSSSYTSSSSTTSFSSSTTTTSSSSFVTSSSSSSKLLHNQYEKFVEPPAKKTKKKKTVTFDLSEQSSASKSQQVSKSKSRRNQDGVAEEGEEEQQEHKTFDRLEEDEDEFGEDETQQEAHRQHKGGMSRRQADLSHIYRSLGYQPRRRVALSDYREDTQREEPAPYPGHCYSATPAKRTRRTSVSRPVNAPLGMATRIHAATPARMRAAARVPTGGAGSNSTRRQSVVGKRRPQWN